MKTHYDVIIVGTGISGCFAALNLPENKQILMITKSKVEESDSFLAQGGICVLKDKEDYDSFFEDTMRAGHYKNNKEAVDIMISSSKDTIKELISYGVDFENSNGKLLYTKEGAHSSPRILYHKDLTGKEITQTLISEIKKRSNITILEHTTMKDLITDKDDNNCLGITIKTSDDKTHKIYADYTIWATGGIGGIYSHSTNYRHLTADALYIAFKRNIKLKNVNYVQIHPTSLYSKTLGRRFLISESVRGEGAVLLNKKKERFVDELLPRDLLTERIYAQMKKDKSEYVWLSMKLIKCNVKERFPTIYKHCKNEGYDITKDLIPVVPSQHYFMGGVKVDLHSRTSMNRLYAVGETSCNGVHGSNRLASNSLLESLVFAKRAALDIKKEYNKKEIHNE